MYTKYVHVHEVQIVKIHIYDFVTGKIYICTKRIELLFKVAYKSGIFDNSHLLIMQYKKRLLLRCIHHFKSDIINNMDNTFLERLVKVF